METGKKYRVWDELPVTKGQPVSMNDYVLWKEFKDGSLSAYSAIYRKYFFVLYNYGKKICSDNELIKDCIQELFIKIWNNRDNLADTTSIKYYLFTSLRRKLMDTLNTPHMRLAADKNGWDEEMVNNLMNHTESGGDEVMAVQKEQVLNALNQLSGHQQRLLQMKFYKNLSNKEIADELGITIQSVYNAVFKALRSLRKHFPAFLMPWLWMFSA